MLSGRWEECAATGAPPLAKWWRNRPANLELGILILLTDQRCHHKGNTAYLLSLPLSNMVGLVGMEWG